MTILAWLTMVGGGLLVPISVISLLMIFAGSHGTQNASLVGGLLVIGGPPALVVVGFGLWRRQRWAHAGMLALLILWAGSNLQSILRGSTPERTYIAPSGVRTTTLATRVNHPWHLVMIALSAGVLVKLLTPAVRTEFGVRSRRPTSASPPVPSAAAGPVAASVTGRATRDHLATEAARERERGWRVGHQGRDTMYYEEWRAGGWQRLPISGEMLMGPAHHVIYFASPTAWQQYPEWARSRRDEIIARIKSQFRAPEYAFHGDGTDPSPARSVASMVAPIAPAAAQPTRVRRSSATPAQMRALWIAIASMFVLAAGTGWLFTRGLTNGDTWVPGQRTARERQVQRAEEPELFWLSLGVYAVVAMGTAGLGVWGLREARRLRRE